MPCAQNGCDGALRSCAQVLAEFEQKITEQGAEEICASYNKAENGICNPLELDAGIGAPRNTNCNGPITEFNEDGITKNPKNSRERSMYRGISVQAYKKGIEEVIKEFKDRRYITVPADSRILPLAEATLALMYRNYRSNTEPKSKETIDRICTEMNGPAGSICSAEASNSLPITLELKQIDCRLAGTRSSLEYIFLNLALTKAHEEAGLRYAQARDLFERKMEEYLDALEEHVDNTSCPLVGKKSCKLNAARRHLRDELRPLVYSPIYNSSNLKTAGDFLVPKGEQAASCGSRAMNDIGSIDRPASSLPSRTADMPWQLLFGGMFGFHGFRRSKKRERKERRKKKTLLPLDLSALGLTIMSIGCGADVPIGLSDILECNGTTISVPAGTTMDCDDPGHDLSGDPPTGARVADAGNQANQSMDATDKLKDADHQDVIGEVFSAAASGINDNAGPGSMDDIVNQGEAGGAPSVNLPNAPSPSSGSGGGGSGFAGGGGSGKSLSDVGPRGSGGGTGNAEEMAATAEDVGATYSGGGGGKKGGGKAAAANPFSRFGARKAGEGVAGGGNIDFGGDAGGRVDPMGSEDPEDYFARIGVFDSLFKIVERRYRQTTGTWAVKESQSLLQQRTPASAPQPQSK